jgi:nucleotidyltransferase/DNA polymerase involved in DNA repair
LEGGGSGLEPHGWGAAYVGLEDLVRDRADAVAFCGEVGQRVRRELGEALQPALGWDSSKFTAQAAGRRTPPGHLRAVDAVRERDFLQPLPVSLLPLGEDARQRLCFLGLRTLGQYAALPRAAVWQQFGRAGRVAHRCARGEDDRPVVPRGHAPQPTAAVEFETPLAERERLVAALRRLVSPLLAELRGNLQACGQVRLTVCFDNGSAQERERAFLFPVAGEERVLLALGQLLDGMSWRAAATAVAVSLGQIQEVLPEQLTLFPLEDPRQEKLREVERYLAARFGASPFGVSLEGNHLRRPVLTQPGAPLPEWRVAWLSGDDL